MVRERDSVNDLAGFFDAIGRLESAGGSDSLAWEASVSGISRGRPQKGQLPSSVSVWAPQS